MLYIPVSGTYEYQECQCMDLARGNTRLLYSIMRWIDYEPRNNIHHVLKINSNLRVTRKEINKSQLNRMKLR